SYERDGEAWQQAVQAKFAALAHYLGRRRIRLVIISSPAKETVEADMLPPEAPRLPADTQFHKLRRFLAASGEWIYVNGQDFMAVLIKPTESIEFSHTVYHSGLAVPEGTFSADPDGFFETVYRTHEWLRGDKLPPMVLYGNSFAAPYLNAGLYFQFAEVHSVR